MASVDLDLILQTARAQAQLQRDMQRAGQRAGRGASDAFDGAFRPRNLADTLLPAAGASLVVGGFGKIVKAAQSYEAALNATTQVYGQMSGEINEFVNSQSRALGLAKGDAQDYANQFGSIFIGLGKSQVEAAKFSTELTKAGAALAAFRNTSVDQAIQALQAGFRGEFDSLQRFIPQVSDLTLTNKALAMGLAETRSEVDQQDKAMALLDITQNSVARSAGQAELEQGNLQTRLAETQAQAKDTAAALGRQMIPALSATLDGVNSVGPGFIAAGAAMLLLGRRIQTSSGSQAGLIAQNRIAFTSSSQLTQALARQAAMTQGLTVAQAIAQRSAIVTNNQIIGANRAVQAGVTGTGTAYSRLAGQAAGASAASAGFGRVTAALPASLAAARLGVSSLGAAVGGPFTIAIVAATLGLGYLITQQNKQKQAAMTARANNKTYAESIAEIGDSSSKAALALAAKELIERGTAARADRAGISLSLLTKAYAGQQDAIFDLNRELEGREKLLVRLRNEAGSDEERNRLNAQLSALRALREDIAKNGTALEDAANKTDLLSRATGENTDRLGNASDAYARGKAAIDAYRTAEELLTKGRQDALDANIAYEQAIDDITESITKNGTSLDIGTDKGRANVNVVRDLIQAAYDQAAVDVETTGVISANTQKKIDGLRATLTQMGFTKQEVDNLLAAYKRIPPEVATQVKVLGGYDAEGELTKIGRAAVNMIAQYNLTPVQAMGLAQGRDPRAVFGQPRAHGGPIGGPDRGDRADNVLFRATPGEWVIQRPAVRKLERQYGSDAMPMINSGELPGYAVGGKVGHNLAPKTWLSWSQLMSKAAQLSADKKSALDRAKAAAAASGGTGNWDGTVAPGALGRAQQWILSQAGGRYLWAGVGNKASDCSGFVGNVWAALTGNPQYRRYFTTHNMGPGRFGMQPGPGNVTVYLHQGGGGGGHTAINVGGLHGEAYGGNGTPFAIGRVGTRLSYYSQRLHMPGFAHGGRVDLAPSDPGASQGQQIDSFLQRGWPEPPANKALPMPAWLMDAGGILRHGEVQVNRSGHDELTLNPAQTQQALNGGEIRLDAYSIACLAQAMSALRPQIVLDGQVVAEAAFNHAGLR